MTACEAAAVMMSGNGGTSPDLNILPCIEIQGSAYVNYGNTGKVVKTADVKTVDFWLKTRRGYTAKQTDDYLVYFGDYIYVSDFYCWQWFFITDAGLNQGDTYRLQSMKHGNTTLWLDNSERYSYSILKVNGWNYDKFDISVTWKQQVPTLYADYTLRADVTALYNPDNTLHDMEWVCSEKLKL
ncbi:MAG: hypothetical protein NC120_14225 [Ruminococcus sp.]|nr:hypothetical protein [Ruminococcus sp.]